MTITCEVEVDPDDFDDNDLSECLRVASRRGLRDDFSRDYAVRAYEALLRGSRGEAIALLDRALFQSSVTYLEFRKVQREAKRTSA